MLFLGLFYCVGFLNSSHVSTHLIDFSGGTAFDNVRLETLTNLLGEGICVFRVLQDGLGFVHHVVELKQLLFEGQEGMAAILKVRELSSQP